MKKPPHDWSAFDGFELPRRSERTWNSLTELVESGRRFAAKSSRAFPSLLEAWDAALSDCGGDPSRTDWSHFRPLRVEREEDCSDWLQHFIATSSTGYLSEYMFGRHTRLVAAQCVHPRVLREDTVDDRRADIVVTWAPSTWTHIEVKVGDESFAKTAETALKLEQKHSAEQWTHFVLLPSEDVERWHATDHPAEPVIQVLTWDDVAASLRRALRKTGETSQWRHWAQAFCGLIEQRLLGHPLAVVGAESLSTLARRLRQISIMKRALEDV